MWRRNFRLLSTTVTPPPFSVPEVGGVAFGSQKKRRRDAEAASVRHQIDVAPGEVLDNPIFSQVSESDLNAIEADAKAQAKDRFGFLVEPDHFRGKWRLFWRELRRYEFSWRLASSQAPILEFMITDHGYGRDFATPTTALKLQFDQRSNDAQSRMIESLLPLLAAKTDFEPPLYFFMAPGAAPPVPIRLGYGLASEVQKEVDATKAAHGEEAAKQQRTALRFAHNVWLEREDRQKGTGFKPIMQPISVQSYTAVLLDSWHRFMTRNDVGVPMHQLVPKAQLQHAIDAKMRMRQAAGMDSRPYTMTPEQIKGH